ncbi:hypothetical protein, partial [Escherichia coli]|uniref:hypothetical protein n=1 Tax=Escherichia coli TaxID=562 RepID=UPI0019540CF6
DRLREFQDEFREATSAFLAEYPALKEQAKGALNGLYTEADYPTLEALSTSSVYACLPCRFRTQASSASTCRPTCWTASR